MWRPSVEARDEYGNLLSFFNEPVSFEVSGPVELIGPSVISLEGGMGGTYIKTTGECGEARLVIRNAQTEPLELHFAAAADATEIVRKEREHRQWKKNQKLFLAIRCRIRYTGKR